MRCKIDIVDDTQECPLCHGVLDGESDSEDFVSVTYPNVAEILKLPILVIRIVIFASVIVLAAAMIVNYITFDGVYWSAIVAVGLFYGCFTLVLLLKERKSLQRKVAKVRGTDHGCCDRYRCYSIYDNKDKWLAGLYHVGDSYISHKRDQYRADAEGRYGCFAFCDGSSRLHGTCASRNNMVRTKDDIK